MSDIPKLYETYATNTARFPALYTELASQLGVSPESVAATRAGFIPVDEQGNWAWAIPERNAKGGVIGISKRLRTGKKYMVKGSKRGLVYAVNRDTTQYESRQWVRVSAEHPCPLCGKPDGCLYPEGEYDDPNAVICVHIATGAAKPMKLGHLHILDPARQKLQMKNYSALLPSDHPILVVEGASDVCAAYDLDFTAVGKPSAASKSRDLVELLAGRDVVVMGENDAGAGKAGMEATAKQLQSKCPKITKLMPPKGVKDLRQWVEKGLTQEELLRCIEAGDQVSSIGVLADDRSRTVADTWITNYKTIDGVPSFGLYNEGQVGFDGVGWEELSKGKVRKMLYGDMGYKSYVDATGAYKPYKLTCSKVRDILEACNVNCLIEETAPCWLVDGDHPDPSRLIIFQNGILDVDRYIAGDTAGMMLDHSPSLFSFYKLPYAFDEDAESPLWDDTTADIFQHEDKLWLASEWYGYNLVPDMSQEKLIMLKGQRRAGKGTYCNTMQFLLGGEPNASSTTFPSLRGSHGLAPLKNALSAVIGDATSNKPGDEDAILLKILNIVGRDASVLNPKHKDHLSLVRLRCRFTFAMNFFPRFRDDSGALEDRTMILTFNNSHSGREDVTLKDELARQASEGKLINWALQGLKRLYTNGKFTVPEESVAEAQAFAELVSPLGHFSRRCIAPDPTGPGVPEDYLYDVWKWWMKEEGLKYGGKSDFLHKLLAMTPGTNQLMSGEAGNPERMLMGIKITEWACEAQNRG